VAYFTPVSPADREYLLRRKTNNGNEVTTMLALLGGRYKKQVPDRKQHGGGIVKEANAGGKATGYADVDTRRWKVER